MGVPQEGRGPSGMGGKHQKDFQPLTLEAQRDRYKARGWSRGTRTTQMPSEHLSALTPGPSTAWHGCHCSALFLLICKAFIM